jgi:hypothetical protein
MLDERALAGSPRFSRLIEKFKDREYRQSYAIAHARRFLARQMRKFRGDRSQAVFADVIDKQPTQVQRLEDPNGKHTLQTLFDVASRLDVALFIRFVDHRTFLKLSDDLSEEAFEPLPYEENEARAAEEMAKGDAARALDDFLQETFKQRPLPPPIEPANENSQEKREFLEDQRRRMRA